MLTPAYEIVSVDRNGANRWTHPDAVASENIRYELNGAGSFAFEVPAEDPGYLAGKLEPIVREVQVWRGTKKIWWGVITNVEVSDLKTAKITCAGLLWYFSKRYVGSHAINNILNNGSFDTGALPNWSAVGVTANIVTQWGYRPGETYQLNLYQGGAGTDTFVTQTVTVPGGVYWTLSGWFHIRTDAQWVGPAVDGRGLYVERLGADNSTVEEVQFFAITDETPRGVFQRATVNIFSPSGRTSIFRVRLYATRCTNPTPTGGRPPGGIIWDQIKLVAMESLSFAYGDLANIINGLVNHAQSPSFGKSSLNITGSAPTTGALLDRTYQYVEHREILDALKEFPDLGICDIDVQYDSTTNNRWVTCWAPKRGTTLTDLVLEEGSRSGVRSVPSIEKDGTKTVTTSIVMGEGSGPDREQGAWADTSATDGIVLEEIYTPSSTATPSFDLLPGIATQRVAQQHKVPVVPKIVCSPWYHDRIGLGDTVKVIIPTQKIDAFYRIVALEVDPRTDAITVEVN
jgi:hypothetical protein